MQTQKNIPHVLEPVYISRDAQHGNLHQLSVTMSRVTFLILRAHTGTGLSHSQHKKNSEGVSKKYR